MWECNRAAWELWLAVASQWRVSMAGLVGLDYPAVLQVAGILAVEMTPGVLKKIQALERRVMQRGEA